MYCLELAGEDDAFAAAEAAAAATDVSVVAPGLATASAISADRVRGLGYTRRAFELLGRADATVDGVRALLEASALDRSGSVAVRARDVRGTAEVDTQRVERTLGTVLVDRGFAVDLDEPDHELRAVFADGTSAVGWLVAESRRDFGDRAPTEKPFFQPGSIDPLEARALANLAGAGPGTAVLDPMCGTAGILVEAGLVGARAVGFDVQAKMARGARTNLAAYLGGSGGGDFHVGRADATRLPLVDGAVDAAVVDVPYGRQSKVEGEAPDALVRGVLRELRRVTARAVVVGDRRWNESAAAAGWTVDSIFERPVHRSLTRYVHVLEASG